LVSDSNEADGVPEPQDALLVAAVDDGAALRVIVDDLIAVHTDRNLILDCLLREIECEMFFEFIKR
jgi:hypothetical protein